MLSSFSTDGKSNVKERVLFSVVETFLQERYFDSLRTKQGLGYIVQAFSKDTRKIMTMNFIVQSNTNSAEYIWRKTNEFLKEKRTDLKNIDNETFKNHVNSIILDLKIKDLNLETESTRNFNAIKTRSFDFDLKQQKIKLLEEVTKEEVYEFFEKLFVNEQRRLDVMYVCEIHKEEQQKLLKEFYENLDSNSLPKENANKDVVIFDEVKRFVIDSIHDYKKKNSLYPDFFSEDLKFPKF